MNKRFLVFLPFLFSILSFADQPEKKANIETDIIPMSSDAERYLKGSPLAPDVRPLGARQAEFRAKTKEAYTRLSKNMKFEKVDPIYFVYDCLFLDPKSLAQQYPKYTPETLMKARAAVLEVFEK